MAFPESLNHAPPRAEKRIRRSHRHGVELEDPYAWLRSGDWDGALRDARTLDEEIRRHLEAENAYSAAIMAPVAALRETLRRELRGRIDPDDFVPPLPDGDYAYYYRYEADAEHPCYRRVPTARFLAAAEETSCFPDSELLLDPNPEASSSPYFRLGMCAHAPDHRRLAYSVDCSGGEYFDILIRDIGAAESRRLVCGVAPEIVWDPDAASFYYIRYDGEHRPFQLRRRRLDGGDDDDLIYEEKDKGFFLSASLTSSRRFLRVELHDHDSSETRLLDATDRRSGLRLLAPRREGVIYSVEHHAASGRLIVLTNADGAIDFKIAAMPIFADMDSSLRDLVPHRPGRFIEAMTVTDRLLTRLEMRKAQPYLIWRRFGEEEERELAVAGGEARHLRLIEGLDYRNATIRYAEQTPQTPTVIHEVDVETGRSRRLKRRRIPSGHDSSAYVSRRLWALGADGVEIPTTVLHRRDTPIDGRAPLLLYGYGAYGIPMAADFNPNRFSLTERGFVYAIAHIRGGRELGWGWYLDGKGEAKTKSFDDFIAVARMLIDRGYAAEGRIVAEGASAGGLLMGAVANRAPSLFAGVVAAVPFVDALNTMLDASLPLTPPEWKEWGDPISDPQAFARIRSYSPYDAVSAQAYPAILAIGAVSDPRVGYWEPAKWTARLREKTTSSQPILLHTHMEAGHGGSSGRYGRLDDEALIQSFALCAVDHPDARCLGEGESHG